MKKLLLFALFISVKITAQDFVGTWKVESYEDEIVYYNKSKDSIYYKDEARKQEANNFKQMCELLIMPMTYIFNEHHEFEMKHPMLASIKGSFEIDRKKQQLLLIEEDNKPNTVPYQFHQGVLFLRMELQEGFVKVGFEKVNE